MRIGIDLGGTKIEGIALNSPGEIVTRLRVPTPRGASQETGDLVTYERILDAVVGLVRHIETVTGESGSVGVGIPGTLSPATGLVKNANTVALIGHPLDRDLEKRLGRPVRVANDANCFALSEASDGAATDLLPAGGTARDRSAVVFGVIVGTGTGGGIVVNGTVLAGLNGIGGEWGHNPLPWPHATSPESPGPPCYCGKHGCIETYLSGPGLARDHQEQSGQVLTTAEIATHAEAGDAACSATLARFADRFARAVATVINVIDPDVIVVGGGVSNIARLYTEVPRLWGRYVFSDVVNTHLVPARHGDSSGVRGAAWLWPVSV